MKIYTAERTYEQSFSDNPIYQRLLFAYIEVEKYIKGNVLEIGCGDGYGTRHLVNLAEKYTAVDKYKTKNQENLKGANFIQTQVPILDLFEDNFFDVVVSFQVIEHIKQDDVFISEIFRVLKPNGICIITTPNIKMSLSRNPFHVREYTVSEIKTLVSKKFSAVELKGVFGDETLMKYHDENRKSIRKYTRFDILNLQYNLPRWMLRIPYDILNRMNRLRLKKQDSVLVTGITIKNFYLENANDNCLDFFCIIIK